MKRPESNFVKAAWVRRAVVPEGDIRGDIEFQNDINLLLARMDGNNPPLRALDWSREAVPSPAIQVVPQRTTELATQTATVDRSLRVIYRGSTRVQLFADPVVGVTTSRRV
jgi:hypothetical protein